MKVQKNFSQLIPDGYFLYSMGYHSRVKAELSLINSMEESDISYLEYINSKIVLYRGNWYILLKGV